MKKGIVIILIAAFVASMLTACGKSAKATASPAESATDEPTVVVTHPVVADEELTIPIGKDEEDYDPEAGEPALEDPNSLPAPPAEENTTNNVTEDPGDPNDTNYVYYPDKYAVSYHEFDDGTWVITIDNPHNTHLYLKDMFGLPRQDYFWVNNETFDCIGYFFACGMEKITIEEYTIKAETSDEETGLWVEYSGDLSNPRNTSLGYSTYKASSYTDSVYNHTQDLETGNLVYLYDQSNYPTQLRPIDSYFVKLLPAYINATIKAPESQSCPLDGYNIPHIFVEHADHGNDMTCAESAQ